MCRLAPQNTLVEPPITDKHTSEFEPRFRKFIIAFAFTGVGASALA